MKKKVGIRYSKTEPATIDLSKHMKMVRRERGRTGYIDTFLPEIADDIRSQCFGVRTAARNDRLDAEELSNRGLNLAAWYDFVTDMSISNYKNIYLDTEELYEFLSETSVLATKDIWNVLNEALPVEPVTDSDIYSIHHIAWVTKKEAYLSVWGDPRNECKRFSCIIHVPNHQWSIEASIVMTHIDKDYAKEHPGSNLDNSAYNYIVISTSVGKEICVGFVPISPKTFKSMNDPNDQSEIDKMARCVINLVYYLHAFPDALRDGVPSHAYIDTDVSIHGNNLVVSQDKALFDKIRENRKSSEAAGIEKRPHFRSGHFRTFRSPRYTKMRFKTIYINAMWVHGNAQTAVDLGEPIHNAMENLIKLKNKVKKSRKERVVADTVTQK